LAKYSWRKCSPPPRGKVGKGVKAGQEYCVKNSNLKPETWNAHHSSLIAHLQVGSPPPLPPPLKLRRSKKPAEDKVGKKQFGVKFELLFVS